ncbi:MAG: Type 1 glutamine amidotransferase-like domain-containing protein [Lapillicoccus sp.]
MDDEDKPRCVREVLRWIRSSVRWENPLHGRADSMLGFVTPPDVRRSFTMSPGPHIGCPHWMRHSGLADLLPSLPETVWVGVSAGSMVMTPRIGDDFVEWQSAPDDRALGVVDFSIFPHLGHEMMPENTLADAQRWAAEIAEPAYAIDDQTAIRITDGLVEVVSEGQWKRFSE